MRSTVRIEDDLMLELKKRARRDKASLTRTLNRVLRAGLLAPARLAPGQPYREETVAMGSPRIDLDRALALASAMEDEETLRELQLRK